MLILFVAFLIPQLSFSQGTCHFSAQVSTLDDCCIVITAGCEEDDAWQVVVDGITTYDYTDYDPVLGGKQIMHCYAGNGTHSVNFYVYGELYWSQIVTIENCDDEESYCNDCEIEPISAIYSISEDPCKVDFDITFSVPPFSDYCSDHTFTWDFGDGTTSTPSPVPSTSHAYTANGTYLACVTLSIKHPNGEYCVISNCVEVVVENCEEEETCCDFEWGGPSYLVHPFDPCIVRLSPGALTLKSGCTDPTYSWDLNNDGTVDYVGKFFITTMSGPGPHTACLTITFPDCELEDCITFELPDCDEGMTPGGMRTGNWDTGQPTSIEIFPNPATNQLNIKLIEDIWNPAEMILIQDVSGKVVQVLYPAGSDQIELDISRFASGVYNVQIIGQEGLITTERFVKAQP